MAHCAATPRPTGYGGDQRWFNLGDRDLGTHLFRTPALAEGAGSGGDRRDHPGLGPRPRLLPVTDDPLRTMVTLDGADGRGARRSRSTSSRAPRRRRGLGPVRRATAAAPAPGCSPPSPTPSGGDRPVQPDGVDRPRAGRARGPRRRHRRRDKVVVSPIVAGSALKGPADRLLTELGHEATVVGIARLYALGRHARHRRGRCRLGRGGGGPGRACVVTARSSSSGVGRPGPHGHLREPPRGARRGRRGGGTRPEASVAGLEVFGVAGIAEMGRGDDLAGIIAGAVPPCHGGSATATWSWSPRRWCRRPKGDWSRSTPTTP